MTVDDGDKQTMEVCRAYRSTADDDKLQVCEVIFRKTGNLRGVLMNKQSNIIEIFFVQSVWQPQVIYHGYCSKQNCVKMELCKNTESACFLFLPLRIPTLQ